MKKRGGLLVFLVTLLTIFLAMTGVRMTAKAEDGHYLTFTGTSSFSIKTANDAKNWNGTLEYSTDANTWNKWNGSAINSGANNKLYIRGYGNTVITGDGINHQWQISSSETVACNGDIRTLLNYSDPSSSSMDKSCFHCMFYGCTSLTEAPELPATSLADSCYLGMFHGCTNLTSAPELPATSLAEDCYYRMFNGCTNLTSAPELPATSLAMSCYYLMFYGCKSLTEAPELPATSLANYCYRYMFSGCKSLTKAPELPATSLADSCYHGMFYDCTSLTEAPELPATSLADFCYAEMFYDCTSLTKTPELPATSLAVSCYYGMFYNCTSLTEAPELPATSLADSCYKYMFRGCTSLKFSETPGGIYNKVYKIPYGTTAIDPLKDMFLGTGGSFTGTPDMSKTYYIPGYSVTLTGGNNATASGNDPVLLEADGSMSEVTYTADTDYCFVKFQDITQNGITVKWINDTKLTVSGIPTATTTIKIPDAQKNSYTVTYIVVNGTWSDGTTADKTETVDIGSKPANIPTGMIASDGYADGAWDKNPANVTITEETTFTFTFKAKPSTVVEADAAAVPTTNIGFNSGLKIVQKKGKIKFSWDKAENIDRCEVYVSYCGKDFSNKPTKVTKSNSVTIKKIKGKKIDFSKNMKVFVKGYDTSGSLVGKTVTAHFAGMDSKNIKNPEKLKLSTKSLTLNKGQSAKIKASVKMEKGKKQAMADSHVATLRYRSGNPNVATIDKKGNVTAVNTGTCSVYVYTKNGLAKEVAVTVN